MLNASIGKEKAVKEASFDAMHLALIPTRKMPRKLVTAFFLLGIGSLIPINALLSVLDFYSLLFPALSAAQYITNAYTLPFMITGTILTAFPPPPLLRGYSIGGSYAMFSLLFILIPLLSTRDEPYPTYVASITSAPLFFVVVITATMGFVNALDQSVLFGIIGLLPGSSCTTAYNAGGAAASVFLVSLRVITRMAFDDPYKPTPRSLLPGFYFFFSACTMLSFFCVLAFLWMSLYSSDYKIYVNGEWQQLQSNDRDNPSFLDQIKFAGKTLSDIRIPALCQFTCFTVSLMFFPGIMSKVPTPLRENVSVEWSSWYPLVVVAMFAIGDTLGRLFLSAPLARKHPSMLSKLTLVRFLFVPLLIAQWTGIVSASWPVILGSVFFQGYANGFIMNMGFLIASGGTTIERRESAGRLMFLMLNIGLSCGSSCGWALELILKKLTSF